MSIWNRIRYELLYRRYSPLKELKWFIQRGRRGWADCDTWSLDNYLAKVISESIVYLADNAHGYHPEYPNYNAWASQLKRISGAFAEYNELDDWTCEIMNDGKLSHEKKRYIIELRFSLLKKEMHRMIDIFERLWD